MDKQLRQTKELPPRPPEIAPSEEALSSDERGSAGGETLPAQPSIDTSASSLPRVASPQTPQTPQTPSAPRPQELKREIQHILSEDIADIYRDLPSEQKTLVAQEGRVAANRIMDLLRETKVRMKELVSVLRQWLQKIPGLNRFFVEQEARIKATKILTLKR